jgi:hypothetical protein
MRKTRDALTRTGSYAGSVKFVPFCLLPLRNILMNAIEKNPMKKSPPFILLFGFVFVTLSMLVACGPSAEDLAAIDYAPLPGDDWQISTLMSRVLIRIWRQSFSTTLLNWKPFTACWCPRTIT